MRDKDVERSFAGLVNIGPDERRKGKIFGIIMLGAAAAMVYLFASLGINQWWGLLLWLPLFLGAFGILQCYHHT